MKAVAATITVLLLTAAPAAHAAEGEQWSLGVSASFAGEDFDNTGAFDFDDGGIFGVQLGYRINRWFLVEAEVERFTGFEADESFPLIGSVESEVDGWILALNGRFYISDSGLQPYLLAGAGYMRAEVEAAIPQFGLSASDDESAAVFQGGVGATLPIGDAWLVELEGVYRLPSSDLEDLNFWSAGLGLKYRF